MSKYLKYLQDKVIIVTGAASGFGKLISESVPPVGRRSSAWTSASKT